MLEIEPDAVERLMSRMANKERQEVPQATDTSKTATVKLLKYLALTNDSAP